MTDKMKELYIAQINAKMAQINPRLAYLNDPKSLDQISTHCDAILSILTEVKEIQASYSITMDPPADQIISMIEKTRDIRATDFAVKAANLNIEKFKAISNERKRAELLDEAKMLIIDAKNLVSGAEYTQKLDAALEELKALG